MLRKRWSGPRLPVRTPDEIAALERAGAVVVEALRAAARAAQPGVSTADIDAAAAAVVESAGAAPLFQGYRQGDSPPFPAVCCISLNEEVVHGIPSPDRIVRAGDLVSVDVGVRLDGWCGDSGTTILIPGPLDPATPEPPAPGAHSLEDRRRLIETTRGVLDAAVSLMAPGLMWSDIARQLERLTLDAGLGYVAEYVGHGIGRQLHEPPKAPAYWTGYSGPDFQLREGMVLAVEPLLIRTADAGGGTPGASGRLPVRTAPDRWTILAPPGSIACHEEYMIAIEAAGARPLSAGGRAAIENER